MAGTFGGAVKIQGQSEYIRAINNMTAVIKTNTSEMKLSQVQYDNADEAMKSQIPRLENVARAYGNLQTQVSNYRKLIADLVGKQNDQIVKHNELGKTLEEEKKVLENLREQGLKNTKQYEEQAKKVQDLENKYTTSQNAIDKNQKSIEKYKQEMNKTSAQMEETRGKLRKLTDEQDNNINVTKESEQGWTQWGQVMANIKTRVVNAMIDGVKELGSKVLELGKSSVEAYATFESQLVGVQKLYGDSANIVLENASEAYKTLGISMNEYIENAQLFSATLINRLGDTGLAAEYVDRMMNDMADNTAALGTDLNMVANAYRGFARGTYVMLDNLRLGYDQTKAEAQRLVKDASELVDIQEELGITVDGTSLSLDNMINAISVIQKHMGIAGLSALQMAKTLSGVSSVIKSNWENLLIAFADDEIDAEPLVVGLLESVNKYLTLLVPRILNIGESIMGGISTVFNSGAISEMIGNIFTLVTGETDLSLRKVLDHILAFSGNLRENFSHFVDLGLDTIKEFVKGFINGIPDFLQTVPTIISNFAGLINDNFPKILATGLELIWELIKGIVKAIPTLIAEAPKIVMAIVDVITAFNWLNLGKQILTNLKDGVIKKIPDWLNSFKDIAAKGWNAVKNFDWLSLGKAIIDGIKLGITNFGSAIANTLKNVVSNAWTGVKNFFGIHSPSRKGMWLGEMIDKGIALGISGNDDEIEGSIKEVNRMMASNLANIPSTYATTVDTNAITNNTSQDLVSQFKQALGEMKIELDDEQVGKFVDTTVTNLVYS